MTKHTIRNVLIFGSITLVGILSLQLYSLGQAWELRDEHFDQRVRVALHQVAERIIDFNEGTLPAKNLIHRKSSNYYLVNIEDVIDANALEYFLHDELSNVALHLDFEYAVFDCFSDQMVYGKYCKVENNDEYHQDRELPKYDDFLYYFGVRFPTKASYVLSGLTRYFIGALLVLVTIGFFIYATYVLLSQKKITEMQKDFINNMTHEFKTPLTSIRISSEVLANSPIIKSDSRLTQYVDIIQNQETRLNDQIERVLNIATFDKKSMDLHKEKVNLNSFVRDVALSRKAEIEKNHGTLIVETTVGKEILADKVHLSNILHNLLDNAIKYSGKSIDILMKTQIENDIYTFTIRDKGRGMSKEQLQHIGQKFYRVSKGNIHDVKGFGLGLYYVKQICKLHNWKLNIQSKLNEGTTIKIHFYN